MLRCIRVSALTLGLVLAGPVVAEGQSATSHAAAEKLPTFELMGFPITPVQVQLVGSALVQEQSPTSTLMLGGMPASPHQVSVLAPRPRIATVAIDASLARVDSPALDR